MWIWSASLKWFGNLPLKAKLYISFGWMCLFTVILGAVCLAGIHRISQVTEQSAPLFHTVNISSVLASNQEPLNPVEAVANRFQWIIASLLLLILFLNFVMAWRLVVLISSPIQNACHVLERLSNCDLTVRAKVESSDEAGRMCEALNRTIGNLHQVLAGLMKNSDSLNRVAGQLAGHVEQSTEQCKQQAQLAQQVLDSTRQVAGQEETVAHHSHDAAEAGRASCQSAKVGREIMAQATQTMESAATASLKIQKLMAQLDNRSQEITRVVTTIRDISENTNLLSLNASIEAARAGEHGHGFAVVAGEVRRLAEHTRSATEDIAQMVQSIQQETASTAGAVQSSQASIEDSRQRTAEAHQTLSKIIEHANRTESLADATAIAARDQSAASRDIADSASAVATLANALLQSSNQITGVTENIHSSAKHLSDIVHQFRL